MSVVFRAGDLRHRIRIQQRATTIDSAGGQSVVWTDVAAVKAAIEPLSGRELLAAQAVRSAISHTITVRWQALFADPQAAAALRVVYGTRIFNIEAALNVDERNRLVHMSAQEGLNNG